MGVHHAGLHDAFVAIAGEAAASEERHEQMRSSAIAGATGVTLPAARRSEIVRAIVAAVDAQASLPFIIITLTLTAFFGTNLVMFLLILSIFGWERFARLSRAMTLASRGRGYVLALQTLAFSWPRIYLRHVLPNVASALLVTATINFPETILLETSLSFLGLGIPRPLPSWGTMLADAREFVLRAWWVVTFPGLAILITVLAFNLLGDGLRDALDPKLKR